MKSFYNDEFVPDSQYSNLVRLVLEKGERKTSLSKNRPDNFAVHGVQLRYDLRNGFPLLTERKISSKAAFSELVWILSGSTDVKELQALGVHFWDSWATPEMTAKFGREEGDLGPLYGHQWRNFAGDFDQIKWILSGLEKDPDGKQHRVIAWNPSEFLNVDGSFNVRPLTCHGDFQISHADGYLDMCMTQRSGDLLIGVPFNTAFYAALLHLFAHVLGFKPRTLVHAINDVHIYEDQLERVDPVSGERFVDTLLAREPKPYPTLEINPDLTDFFKVSPTDFRVTGYDPHPKIDFPVTL